MTIDDRQIDERWMKFSATCVAPVFERDIVEDAFRLARLVGLKRVHLLDAVYREKEMWIEQKASETKFLMKRK